jgi:signal transduction histidine kinase
VTVTELEDRTMELVISDDAPGERRRAAFEPITERVNTLNGTIAIESPPQGGTTIRVKLPSYASRFTG